MEAPKFDTLLREFAQHGTRREALGALLGGALLLGSLSEGEATEKAKRRKKRKKLKQASSELLPIQVTVKNPGPRSVDVQFVNLMHSWSLPLRWICINPASRHSILPGAEATFFTRPFLATLSAGAAPTASCGSMSGIRSSSGICSFISRPSRRR